MICAIFAQVDENRLATSTRTTREQTFIFGIATNHFEHLFFQRTICFTCKFSAQERRRRRERERERKRKRKRKRGRGKGCVFCVCVLERDGRRGGAREGRMEGKVGVAIAGTKRENHYC